MLVMVIWHESGERVQEVEVRVERDPGRVRQHRQSLDACSLVIMEHCGGASGPIWVRPLGRLEDTQTANKLTILEFSELMEAAVKEFNQLAKGVSVVAQWS